MRPYGRSGLTPEGEGYNVFFTAETIRQAAQVYFQRGFQHNMNVQHSDKDAESFVFQSYIVDTA